MKCVKQADRYLEARNQKMMTGIRAKPDDNIQDTDTKLSRSNRKTVTIVANEGTPVLNIETKEEGMNRSVIIVVYWTHRRSVQEQKGIHRNDEHQIDTE